MQPHFQVKVLLTQELKLLIRDFQEKELRWKDPQPHQELNNNKWQRIQRKLWDHQVKILICDPTLVQLNQQISGNKPHSMIQMKISMKNLMEVMNNPSKLMLVILTFNQEEINYYLKQAMKLILKEQLNLVSQRSLITTKRSPVKNKEVIQMVQIQRVFICRPSFIKRNR